MLPRDTQNAFEGITHIGMSSRLAGLNKISWCIPEPYWQAAATG